ncbi:MAG: TerC family protein [Syntrophomonadaceae bacterium]|nr:TerC family protein [Syntrophomonadaceae bacterium]
MVALFSIVVIDLVLGGDNAIVIALAAKSLPPEQRKTAIIWGTLGAVGVRVSLTAVALYLLSIPLLQFVGGLMLVWIAFKLLLNDNQNGTNKAGGIKSGKNILDAVKIIILADLLMGIDNVIAIAGAARGSIFMVMFGLAISIPIIVWGSTFILRLMERFPFIIYLGGGVLAWTAGQMIAEDPIILREAGYFIPCFEIIVPVITLILVLSLGYYLKQKNLIRKNIK